MKCLVCGSELRAIRADLPFKIADTAIVILKDLPVLQCVNCSEYLIEDPVMERVEAILGKRGDHSELEIVKFAA